MALPTRSDSQCCRYPPTDRIGIRLRACYVIPSTDVANRATRSLLSPYELATRSPARVSLSSFSDVRRRSAPIYGGNTAVYGSSAVLYGDNTAIYGDDTPIDYGDDTPVEYGDDTPIDYGDDTPVDYGDDTPVDY
eukprot:2043094-Rhodomonas_salina.1